MMGEPESENLPLRLEALVEAGQGISAADTVANLCRLVLDAAERILAHDSAAILLLDGDGTHLEMVAFRGSYLGARPGLRLPVTGAGVTTWVVREGLPQRVDDIRADARHVAGGLEVGSELAVPMTLAGRVLGVVDAQREATSAFSHQDVVLLLALAGYAAIAIGHLRGVHELSSEKSRLELILECSADAIITTDLRGRVSFFSRGAEDMFGYAAADVIGRPTSDYYLGGEREARRVQRYVEDEGKVRNYEAWFRTASGEPLPTSLSASVLRDREGHVLGTLGIIKDITLQKRLERKLSYTIEMLQEANENLGRLAVTDGLSGLKNARFFHRKMEEELLRAARTRRPLSLLLVDIDKFKKFNDTWGHQVGDRVLQEMGKTILESIRKIDHGCRYGGEEFTVILPDTELAHALVVGRRIQQTFARAAAWREIGLEPPTLSIGAVAYQPTGESREVSAEELVKAADEAMYRVKHQGGNAIEAASPIG